MRYLSVEEILALHDYQVERFGGTHGLLSLPLLESAVSRPTTNISGKDMYFSLFDKAAALTYSIIKNHPFVDANKRTGLHAALTFLELNGIKVKIKSTSLVMLGVDIASGKMSFQQIAQFFKEISVNF
jgi:death on curing protein